MYKFKKNKCKCKEEEVIYKKCKTPENTIRLKYIKTKPKG